MFYYRESWSEKAFENETVPKEFLVSNAIISLTDTILTTEYVLDTWTNVIISLTDIILTTEYVFGRIASHM